MIAFNHVSKKYGARTALADVAFSVEPGEWVTIVGASGSGKSSITRLLLRAEDPTSGRIEVDGVDIATLPVPLLQLYRSRVGVVFEDPTFLEHATLEENVGLPLELAGMAPSNIVKIVALVLDHVGLAQKAYETPAALSRSERTLACLARALIVEPNIVIADEPFAGLDETQRALALSLLKQRHKAGASVIVLVSDQHDADYCGGRQLPLTNGRIAAGPGMKPAAKPHRAPPRRHVEKIEEAPTEAKTEHHDEEGGGRKIKITAIHS